MKQVLQNLRSGKTSVVDVPVPQAGRGQLLIRTSHTLISAGTERMLVDFGKANWIDKARQQPDKARQVLDKIRTDGLKPTIEAVFNKLDQPLPMGYCNVGRVAEVGAGVTGYAVGDRVASNGKHAEYALVPLNLSARVPDAVSDEEASFTVLGAIALQGIRLVQPTLGEAIVVSGLGLIGLITVQLLRAQGCRVLGIDFDPAKLAMARSMGAEVVDLSAGQDPVAAGIAFSRGRGIDGVIVTAATKSSEPIHQAAKMSRKRGRIVLVGVTGLELSRADFFEKELTFQVSCSYGPGRYDPNYEQGGNDYPVGFVRWTEQRNFEAVLDMMASGALDVKPLISHRFAIDDAEGAYGLISGGEPSLGVLLDYPQDAEAARATTIALKDGAGPGVSGAPSVSFIGSGNYATGMLIPVFKKAGATLDTIASKEGVTGVHAGRKFGFAATTTDSDSLLAGTSDAVVITTRHNSHGAMVAAALKAGKSVFVEKPLCLTLAEQAEIETAYAAAGGAARLMVGYNRRFAPQVQKMKVLLAGVTGPKAFVMTVNAGAIPAEHWTQNSEIGGGRIIGEACHFVDLLRFLAGAPLTGWSRIGMESATADTVSLSLTFADGSIGTVHYFANGSKAFSKERLEVFAAGRILQLDNFRKLTGFGWPGFSTMKLSRQDKGQAACAQAFLASLAGGPAPIPVDQIFEINRVCIDLANADTPGGENA
ncbi:dehydrogenase [Sphingomonas koreensis]|uniref:bi-domain-containing oxidoreductase n=1 Tax=Sphingomonas koreensis TaxID=93064 RepID=UPI00082A57B4|nr:bi-domain-containing oxidoreductase [Sphingomonas koreensis]PJI89806.1 putative dehydrogenase [Sphingomonas koreensis]RSU61919.1 dehydrogenase [Sphingomonas koreensis]RSU70573.1 dehydrogenase [Sphingomonas koreensis]